MDDVVLVIQIKPSPSALSLGFSLPDLTKCNFPYFELDFVSLMTRVPIFRLYIGSSLNILKKKKYRYNNVVSSKFGV